MTDRKERETNRDSDPLELIAKLREGVVEYRKRWSGDTHSDIGGSVDCDATEHLMRQAATALEAQLRRFNEETSALRDELAQKDARIARLHYFLSEAVVALCEFELSDENDSLLWEISEALNEHPRQSAAALKAEAARAIFDGISQRIDEADQSGIAAHGRYSREVCHGQRKFVDGLLSARLVAKAEAGRIRREALDRESTERNEVAKEQGDEK